jgi:hypothetical protein
MDFGDNRIYIFSIWIEIKPITIGVSIGDFLLKVAAFGLNDSEV